MKGSQFVGLAMVLAGVALVYAGWKNKPVLAVLGITEDTGNTTVVPVDNSTPIGVQNPVSGNPHDVRTVDNRDTMTEPASQPTHNVRRIGGM